MERLPCKYQIGTALFHRMDPDAGSGLVTEIRFCADGGLLYTVVWAAGRFSDHYELELTTARSWRTPEATETE